ncbi:PREDICTED: 5-formyltetrahydrofolate cyclo-ligase-like [Amphimedon queenslandica]|uniref:5-formyltetrahydrofolate cyclo-ligase n=1 Tax=Amphimedon queenslandica TaxID=400682 RepID=A0A1X7UXJ7_AMPQE|nr:PREDICTED: 5-formyltetrahydrofolate cyclo-ligase-like [Amphimedon queenslandica]|eukprot:XP_011403856.2 PREDICTED: 5-formyltetrahydrofolate cyclo-ligase-like [Amphimedon queenslandica]
MAAATTSLRNAKQTLRQSLRKTLKQMTVQQRKEGSLMLTEKLLSHKAYQEASRISIYLSMPEEVDTSLIIEDIFKQKKLCFVPQFNDVQMNMLQVHSLEDIKSLPVYKWGIKQPAFDDKREDALETGGLDLVIVPGLGFTEDGKRLGQGKGYYDGFLARCSEKVPTTIALAYNVQRCTEIPTGPSDIIIQHVIFST